jgi:hypothetical protein
MPYAKKQRRIDSNKYAKSNLTHGKKGPKQTKTPSVFVAPAKVKGLALKLTL